MSEPVVTNPPDSPYKGFVPFLETDAPFFFGREKEIEIISANLRTQRLTLLYGPTAVGKSSVLKAGVLPSLHDLNEQLQRVYVDLMMDNPVLERINLLDTAVAPSIDTLARDRRLITVVVFAEWSGDPLISLKAKIIDSVLESLPKIFTLSTKDHLRTLPLSKMLKYITSHREVLELLIILDQFEEFFVYHSAGPVADSFAEEFSRTVSDQELRVNFLISIREDWLARLDRFKGWIPFIFDNSIRIHHLNRDSAYDAVKKPIDKYNEIIKAHAKDPNFDGRPVIIEENFITEVLNQLERLDDNNGVPAKSVSPASETESIEGRIHTSRLQIVLKYLWGKATKMSPPALSFELVRKPNTVRRIINTNLHKTLNRLRFREKLIAADFFRFLVTTSGTKLGDTAQGLAARTGRKLTRIEPVLDKLSRQDFRVLNQVGPPPGEPSHDWRYELTSDALAGPVLDWAQGILVRKRSLWTAVGYLVITAVLLIILIFVALMLKARTERETAEERRAVAEEEKAKQQRAFEAWKRLDLEIPYSQAVLRRHSDRVTSAVFTPNGSVLTSSADGTAILWDVDKKEPIQEFDTKTKNVISAAISPPGDRVVTAAEDGSIILWRVGTNEQSELRGRTLNKTRSITFNSNGDAIAAADSSGTVTIWNTQWGEVIKEIANSKPVSQLVFSPSGQLLAGASDDHTVHIWKTLDWSKQNSLVGHTDAINSLAFSPDEKLLATGSADGSARIWVLSTGALQQTFSADEQSINNVDFDKDGLQLLTASDDTTARIWSLDTKKSIDLGHTDKVLSASFSPDSQQVVTASRDGVVRIWSAPTGKSLVELRGHIHQVTYITYSSDGKYVLSAGDDGTARVWLAKASGDFDIAQPVISAIPNNPIVECPMTIRFVANLTVSRGRGKIVYRFKGSDGRIWPPREVVFDGPGTKYVNWYWKITENYSGFETIEIIEPKGIREQRAKFTVVCLDTATSQPPASPTVTP